MLTSVLIKVIQYVMEDIVLMDGLLLVVILHQKESILRNVLKDLLMTVQVMATAVQNLGSVTVLQIVKIKHLVVT